MKTIKEYNTLYKKARNGKITSWDIKVCLDKDVPCIVRESGYIDGKKRTNKKYIRKGTNIGKSNEKSPLENAIFIADNYWNDHIEDNYVDDIDNINDPPRYLKPMLAKTFNKNSTINYKNCIVQPKYNGIRAVSFRHINDYRIISRERKEFGTLKHIENVLDIFGNYSPDGELYNHSLTFQEIVRRVKKYREGLTEEIQYHVYDIAIPDTALYDRLAIIEEIIPENNDILHKVHSYKVNSYEEFKNYHDKFVRDGYEGIIIRDINSHYGFNDRPSSLMKYKEFKDAEFEIVGFDKEEWDDDGVIRNLVVWICITKQGETFSVRQKGSFYTREMLYKEAHENIGKMLTVRFQETSENGTPIFGVGLGIRDYE